CGLSGAAPMPMTMPAVVAPVTPHGCPSARTQCPGWRVSGSARVAAVSPTAATDSTARSCAVSRATTCVHTLPPSANVGRGARGRHHRAVGAGAPAPRPHGTSRGAAPAMAQLDQARAYVLHDGGHPPVEL